MPQLSTSRPACPRPQRARTTLWTRIIRQRLLPFVLAVVLLAAGVVQPVAAEPRESRVLPQLQREAAAAPEQPFRVIVTRVNRDRKADAKAQGQGGKKIRDLRQEAFVAELQGKDIAELGRDPSVKYVALDAPMFSTNAVDASNLVTLYPAVVGASSLWSAPDGTGITGAGVGVAVLDTGIARLKDFRGARQSRIVAQAQFGPGPDIRDDQRGHGTHVAGIIAGNSWYRRPYGGKYIGIAPEANLIDVKIANADGMSYVSDVVDAIDWVVTNRTRYNIRVLNLSMISSVAESYKTSVLAAAVEHAWFNGILVVVAAGNRGPDTMYYPPANDPFVITVGAADTMGTIARDDDGMAPWSSYGTTQDGFSKPDVVAPGRSIVAPLPATDSTLARILPHRIVDPGYIRLSGTSMAAPVVSGIAALAFQAHPEWTNDQVKWLLQNTATQLGGVTLLPGQGAGEVDAAGVVSYQGVPLLANQAQPISEHLTGPAGATTYINTPTSTWATSTWATSTWATSTWATSTWATANQATSTWASSVEWANHNVE